MMRSVVYSFALAFLVSSICSAQITMFDTVYTPAGYPDPALTATIFMPEPPTSKGIGIVLGRYSDGTRLDAKVWCDTLAAHGYLAMTIDYSDIDVNPTGLYPKPVRAFKTAVEFLKSNSERFHIDSSRIIGFGQSQGSLVWGQTIIWDNDDAFFGTDSSIDDHLYAAVFLYGAYDMNSHLNTAQNQMINAYFSSDPSLRSTKGQCLANVANITTPLLLIHCTSDPLVNVYHSRTLRDSLEAHGRSVRLIEFGGAAHDFDIIQAGPFTSLGLQAKDSVLAYLEATLTGVEQGPESFPADFSLEQNYPNPFNPKTRIRYSLSSRARVRLLVFNIVGQQVARLVDADQQAGVWEAGWDASGVPSGVYFYRLQAVGSGGKTFVETKKLLFLK